MDPTTHGVHCKVFTIWFQRLRKRGLDPKDYLDGVAESPDEVLRPDTGYVSWPQFSRFLENVQQVWSEDDFVALGRSFLRVPFFTRPAQLAARILFAPMDFYRWMGAPKSPSSLYFPAVQPTVEQLGPQELRLKFSMRDGLKPSRVFFLVCQGSISETPKLLGYPSAEVVMDTTPQGVEYGVNVPGGRPLLRRVWRWLTWPLVARAAARELQASYGALRERYEALHAARARLHAQAQVLQTAQRVCEAIHADLDLSSTLGKVVSALAHESEFVGARVYVDASIEGQPLGASAQAGACGSTATCLQRELVAVSSGAALGGLEVWVDEENNAVALLDAVLPTVSLAVSNAATFAAASSYRQTLETRVQARTVELCDARDALQTTVEELRTAQSARERLFANINHEVRTPLTLIMLAREGLDEKLPKHVRAACSTHMGSIQANVERLVDMVDDLLLLARRVPATDQPPADEGKGSEDVADANQVVTAKKASWPMLPAAFSDNTGPVDMASVARQAVEHWQVAAEQTHVELRYAGMDRAFAEAAVPACERMTANLLSNALKFTPLGGSIEVRVSIAQQEPPATGRWVVLAVSDSGPGIELGDEDQIFERFRRGSAGHGLGGMGLGLALVRELAEAYGGVAKLVPQAVGACFEVRLPQSRHKTQPVSALALGDERGQGMPAEAVGFVAAGGVGAGLPAQLARGAAQARGGTHSDYWRPEDANHGSARLLLVEDDPDLREALGSYLGHTYAVRGAANVAQALALLRIEPADLVIVDFGLPDGNGLDVLEAMRADDRQRLVCGIVITAHRAMDKRLASFAAGAVDVIAKPFRPEEILARVRAQLRIREMALRLSDQERLASLGSLTSGLAHALRNPLNGMLHAAEAVRESVDEGQTPPAELVRVVHETAQRVDNLTQEFFAWHRSGRPNQRQRVLLSELAEQVVRLSQVPADVSLRVEVAANDDPRNQNHQGVEDPTTTDAWVEGDPALLLHGVAALVDNALEAANPGTVVVSTGVDRTQGEAWIEVLDDGPGVASSLRARIFEPFFSTKFGARSTGLGLPLAQQVARSHGGRLELVPDTAALSQASSSAAPSGARFRLTLPAITHAAPIANAA